MKAADWDVVSRANYTRGSAVTEGYCSIAAVSPSLVIKESNRKQTDKKMALDSKYYVIAQSQGGKLHIETESR